MSPFSKIVGAFAAVGAVLSATALHGIEVSFIGSAGTDLLVAFCVAIVTFSHSMTGNGAVVPGGAPTGPQT